MKRLLKKCPTCDNMTEYTRCKKCHNQMQKQLLSRMIRGRKPSEYKY